MAVKRILRYLKGTEDYGLWYKLGGNLDLKVLTDANWAGNIDDKKVQVEVYSSSIKDWYLGQVKRKIIHPNQQKRQNMLQ